MDRMLINVGSETVIFLLCLLFGVCAAVVYDFFRLIRLIGFSGTVIVFVEDILFWFAMAVTTFWFILYLNDGKIRLFCLLGIMLGFLIYYFTLGRLVYGALKKIAVFLKGVFCAAWLKLKTFYLEGKEKYRAKLSKIHKNLDGRKKIKKTPLNSKEKSIKYKKGKNKGEQR